MATETQRNTNRVPLWIFRSSSQSNGRTCGGWWRDDDRLQIFREGVAIYDGRCRQGGRGKVQVVLRIIRRAWSNDDWGFPLREGE